MRTECESLGRHIISMTIGSRGRELEELATDVRGKRENILVFVWGGGALEGGRISGIGIKDNFPEADSVTSV